MAGKKKDVGDRSEEKRQALLREALSCVLAPNSAAAVSARLMDTFGSFDGLFSAPEEIIAQVPGVGAETARFVRLIIDIARVYLEERSWNLQRVFDTSSALELFRPKFLGRNNEVVCLMLLDGKGRVVYNDVICEGSVDQVPLHLRQVLQLCIEYRVNDVFLAHNHPSGLPFPSRNDLVVTNRLMTALQSISVELKDHIIFSGENYYSFAGSGALERQRELLYETQARELEIVRSLERALRGEQETE